MRCLVSMAISAFRAGSVGRVQCGGNVHNAGDGTDYGAVENGQA